MKKLIKILPVVLMVCLVATNVFGVSVPPDDVMGSAGANNQVVDTVRSIWGTVAVIVQILSIACVVFAGLRYMFASADQKADIKKSMGILAVGAILVFGATTIIQVIANTTNTVIP